MSVLDFKKILEQQKAELFANKAQVLNKAALQTPVLDNKNEVLGKMNALGNLPEDITINLKKNFRYRYS